MADNHEPAPPVAAMASTTPTDDPVKETEKPSTDIRMPENANWKFQLRIVIAIALPVFLETLDYTVVATAQPHIASHFNRLDLQSYIGTAYVLTSTVFLPIFASLADIFGRHWALQLALLFFGLGSALSTAAQNMTMLLVGRGIAGVGAAGLLTVVRVLLADFRSLNTNNYQQMIFIVLYAVGFSVGPVIGGALSTISFRWVFAINLPCVALSMFLALVLLRGRVVKANTHLSWVQRAKMVDALGAFLFIGGSILLLIALNWGSTAVWNAPRVIVNFVLGGVLIIAFIAWEAFVEHHEDGPDAAADKEAGSGNGTEHHRKPRIIKYTNALLPLAVFRNFDVVATEFAAYTSGMVMLVAFYFISIFFVIVQGLSATNAGVQLIYFAPGMGVGSIISSIMIKRLKQPKYPIILGSIVIPVALGVLSLELSKGRQAIVDVLLAIAGAGVGMSFGPLAIHARFAQPESRVATVVALNLFFRTLGGTVGIAQCAAVLNARVLHFLTKLVENGTISPEQAGQLAAAGLTSTQGISALPPDLAAHVRDAFRDGTRFAFISLIPWCAISAILVFFLSPIAMPDEPKPEPAPEAEKDAAAGAGVAAQVGTRRPKTRVIGPVSGIWWLIQKAYMSVLNARDRRAARRDGTGAAPAEAAVGAPGGAVVSEAPAQNAV